MYPILKFDPRNNKAIRKVLYDHGLYADQYRTLRNKQKTVKWIEDHFRATQCNEAIAKYERERPKPPNDLQTATDHIFESHIGQDWQDMLYGMDFGDVQSHFCTDRVN